MFNTVTCDVDLENPFLPMDSSFPLNLFSGIFFAWKIARVFKVTSELCDNKTCRTYSVEGQLFFASTNDFSASFDFKEALEKVVLDISL